MRLFLIALWMVAPHWQVVNAGMPDTVYFTNGFKAGEVTDSSVVIWTRLCAQSLPVPVGHQRKAPPFRSPLHFSDSVAVDSMDGAVRGAFGEVRIILKSDSQELRTSWEHVSPYRDYTLKRTFSSLLPMTTYLVTLQGRRDSLSPVTVLEGVFTTAPPIGEILPVTFTSTSCQYFWDFDDTVRGFRVYDRMLEMEPDFHCQTGDYVYYDKPGPMAVNVELARHKWHANNGWQAVRAFYHRVPVYLQKDDHDMLSDDASPNIQPFGELTFPDGKEIWYEQVPVTGLPFRTFRWGQDLQVWIVEGREFRSDNWIPDSSEKSIWGPEQKGWFIETVQGSDATFKVLVSPTPVVGPDRATGKNDNHANPAFRTEGTWLRGFLADRGMFVINGDRHWQYVSRCRDTGLMEFSQGPTSDSHAQGWDQQDVRPEHRFLRVAGGFLHVSVFRDGDQPVIQFTHFDVDGNRVHQETIRKEGP